MKERIFWIGILAIALILEYGFISSPFMLHFTATVLLLILFVFKRPFLFVLGTGMGGVFLIFTSLTPWTAILGWLGVWAGITFLIYSIFPKAHVWPFIVSIISFRVCHYLFSEVSTWAILKEEPILLGFVGNIIFASCIAFWFLRIQ
ncbi:MAG: hypothetical protein ABEI13_04130 [Candidatus Paceibacteria bacterium]